MANAAHSPPLDATQLAALDALFARFNRSDEPGMVVGVARHGRTVYRKAFGLASVQHGVANTPATRMRIGSTTKHFTCLAALLLAEEGRLDLDAPASRYVAELDTPNNRADMPTLRHFMHHTSGRRCGLELFAMANGEADMPKGWMVTAMARQQGRNFALGEGQTYNNGGYHLLSVAVARASGLSFEAFLRERIFEPLGLHDTSCMPDFVHQVPGLAALHLPEPDGGWRLGRMVVSDLLGEGAMVSTVDDMLRWLAHLNGPKRIGNADTWRQMLTPAPLPNGRMSVYAMGLFRHAWRGVELIHHAGTVIGGNNSQMLTVPAHGLDIAIMNNGQPVSVQQIVRDMLGVLLADVLTQPADPLPSLERHRHLVGARYHGPSGVLVGFDALPGDALGLSLMNSPAMPLLRERAGGLVSANFEDIAMGPIEFRAEDLAPGADGEAPAELRYTETGQTLVLQRLPTMAPVAREVGAALVGRYRCDDLGADVEIATEGDALLLRVRGECSGWQSHVLKAYSPQAFGIEGAPHALTIERTDDGAMKRVFVSGLRARHLVFDRVRT
jgi:CubicO group peptidase (beta-lactamase class C family)